MSPKRILFSTLIVVLALGSLGIVAVGAQDDDDAPAPWMGVSVADDDDGVVVQGVVSDSPAKAAGVERGDVITQIDDTAIPDVDTLLETVQSYAVDDKIEVTVLRDDEEMTLNMTLAARPDDDDLPRPEFGISLPSMGMLDILGAEGELTDDGWLVESVDEDSPFAEAGLMAGDLVTAINGYDLTGGARAQRRMMEMWLDGTLTLEVLRGEDEDVVEIEIVLSEVMDDLDITPFSFDMAQPMQLGVQFMNIDADVAEEEGLDVEEGALIVEVYDDTPAAEAGFVAGDIVVAVDGDAVDEEHTLLDRLYAYEEDDEVTFTVLRDGEEISLEATLGPQASTSFQFMPGHGMNFYSFGDDGEFNFEMGPGMHFYGFGDGFEEFFEQHPFFWPARWF